MVKIVGNEYFCEYCGKKLAKKVGRELVAIDSCEHYRLVTYFRTAKVDGKPEFVGIYGFLKYAYYKR